MESVLTAEDLKLLGSEGPTPVIPPFLWVGKAEDALDEEILKNYSFTHVLNLTEDALPPPVDTVEFLRCPLKDDFQQKLEPHLPQIFAFVDSAREAEDGGRVLIHCTAGVSRAPAVALAYAIRYYGWSAEEGLKRLSEERPGVCPNFNFLGQLKAMEWSGEEELSQAC